MACYSPLSAYKGGLTPSGKMEILFKAPSGTERISLPCGKCIGCKLAYSKGWAIRCMHESSTHKQNSFVTLTFDSKHCPKDGNLDIKHVQLFMRRLRKSVGKPVRYFFAGEYGKLGRPHYHGLLFGHDFSDKVVSTIRMGRRIFESEQLRNLWPFGFHSVGDVTFASAAYVARYCVKKSSGQFDHFRDDVSRKRMQVDKSSGECKVSEFTTMSRRPGIGSSWFDRYRSDVYPGDFVVVNGVKNRPPRYYDNLLDKADPDLLENLKSIRSDRVDYFESLPERLDVKREVKLAQIKSLKRTLEV